MKRYYPIFADLDGRSCLVVGGGTIAQRKVRTLLRYGAHVTVISPTLTRQLASDARVGRIRHLARRFRPTDVRGAWLIFACTNEQAINEAVFCAATRRKVLTNVVDQKPLCSFIAPSLFTRGPLTIAVSTGGASPTIAKRLRRELERTVGREYIPMLRLLRTLRDIAKHKLPHYHDRQRYFDDLVQGSVFTLMKHGRTRQARREAIRVLDRYANGRA